LSVRVTEKEFQALIAYAEKYRKSQTQVVRALIRKLPTYEPDSSVCDRVLGLIWYDPSVRGISYRKKSLAKT
jgi:hypothetical protein